MPDHRDAPTLTAGSHSMGGTHLVGPLSLADRAHDFGVSGEVCCLQLRLRVRDHGISLLGCLFIGDVRAGAGSHSATPGWTYGTN
jgi:hypothetical protein